MEMAAMYCENRMTADWTYDIASLEHGRLPDVIDVVTSPPLSSFSRVPIKSQALMGQPFVRRMPDRVLSR